MRGKINAPFTFYPIRDKKLRLGNATSYENSANNIEKILSVYKVDD